MRTDGVLQFGFWHMRRIQNPTLLPQSPLGKAVTYTLGEWDALNRYLQDGRVEIDNNLTENALRPSCIGKKNYLFFGHPEAGWRSAVIYSVIVSCRRRKIDPWEYLRDMIAPVASRQEPPNPRFGAFPLEATSVLTFPTLLGLGSLGPCGQDDAYTIIPQCVEPTHQIGRRSSCEPA